MITIKISDILELLDKHQKETRGIAKRADVIANLSSFHRCLDDSNPDNTLELNELYALALILLKRQKSTRWFGNTKPTKSEILAQTLEDKFGEGIFISLRNQFIQNNHQLSLDQFDSVVNKPTQPTQPAPVAIVTTLIHTEEPVSTLSTSLKKQPEQPEQPAQPAQPQIYPSLFREIQSLQIPTAPQEPRLPSKKASDLPEEKRAIFQTLLSHTALGELDAAEKIWREHPDLLTYYGDVSHPNRISTSDGDTVDIPFNHNPGRYEFENITVLQLMWVNGEFERAASIKNILEADEMKRQFFEIFPNGMIEKYNFDLNHAEELLKAVFDAIKNDEQINAANLDEMNAATRKALDDLYAYAKPTSKHKTGLIFDFRFHLAAIYRYDMYIAGGYYRPLNAKNRTQQANRWAKLDFWCIRVEEWLAACLGTADLRSHALGETKYIPGLNAKTDCLMKDKSSIFAFRRGPGSIPGLHLFVSNGHAKLAGGKPGFYDRKGGRERLRDADHLVPKLIQTYHWSLALTLEYNPKDKHQSIRDTYKKMYEEECKHVKSKREAESRESPHIRNQLSRRPS